MKIAWFTPFGPKSAIGRFSSSVVRALAARGHSLTLVSSDKHPLAEQRPPPVGIELLHWSFFEQDPGALEAHDLIVYNIGNHFDYHCGVLRSIDRSPGVCIFHDFYLVNLFLGWLASGVERDFAHSVVLSIYGPTVAEEFWDRIGRSDFQEWSASQAPMTEWLARKALAGVAHAGFYKQRLEEGCASSVLVLPLAYDAPPHRRITEDLSGRVHILTVGMVNSNKRVEAVIEAIAFSPLLRSRCEYDIVGRVEPSYRARLQSLTDELGLEDAVKLHGEVTDFELRWRFTEADIICCLRWPALEGASASCVEAMSYGKPVIVTDIGFYRSLSSDFVLKVAPTMEIADLTRHLEMLVVDAGERNELGKRAREWFELEHTPERYAERIEPFLQAAVEERPAADALKQIGLGFRAIGVQHADPIVQRIGSQFRSLFCSGSKGETELQLIDGRTDPVKSISNTLREWAPEQDSASGRDLPEMDTEVHVPPAEIGMEVHAPPAEIGMEVHAPPAEIGMEVHAPPAEIGMEVHAPAELRGDVYAPSGRSGDEPQRPSIGDGVRAVLWRLGVLCTKPILSPLRSYFVEPLVDLILSENQRSIGAIQARLGTQEQSIGAIQARLGTQEQSIGAVQAKLDKQAAENRSVRQQIYIVHEKLGALAVREDRAEIHSISIHRLVQTLVNRNILVLGEELLARTPYGYLLAPTDDVAFASFLAEGTIWESATARLLDLVLKEGMTFVDVGANVGIHTLHGARMVGPTGSVIAFEPTPVIFQLLLRSMHLNGLGDFCRCIDMALSSSEGLVTLHVSAICGHNSLYPLVDGEEKATLQVRTGTLDKVLQDANRIDVVKIDVEGAELEVLEGMKHTLANHPDIVLVVEYGVPHLRRLGVDSSRWFGRFFAHGFALFTLDESTGTWSQASHKESNQIPSGNVLFVRPESSQYGLIKEHEK
jgi:FkbM family methyltransferase